MKKIHFYLAGLLMVLVPAGNAFALVCDYVDNCKQDFVPERAIPIIADLLIAVAAGTSIVFIVIGGVLMLTSMGEEGQISKGKMSIIYALIGLLLTKSAQIIVSFVINKFNIMSVGPEDDIVIFVMKQLVDAMKTAFNAVFAVMLIYAGYRMAFARGNADEFNKSKNVLIWAIIGAIIVNLAFPLANAVITVNI